jgi:hypothetical protein
LPQVKIRDELTMPQIGIRIFQRRSENADDGWIRKKGAAVADNPF